MKICKDGRIWGQNNKEAGEHLGVLRSPPRQYIKKGTASQSKQGSKNPMYGTHRSGDKSPMYGKHHSIETRRKMSEAQKGDKGSNWRGGISSRKNLIKHHIQSELWREAVFARDNWTCQKCAERGRRLEAHHIKSFAEYPELRFAIDNGETLCHECHKLTENYGNQKLREEE